MWELSDKYSVFMLLWMIMSAVTTGGFSVVFSLIGVTYAGLTLYHTYRETKK